MSLLGWIFYVILGIVIYFGVELINKKYNISKFDKIIFSIIFMMLISGLCFKYAIRYTDNIFLIFVFMMVTDIIYNTYVVDRDFFDKNENNLLYYIVLVIVGFFVNQEFINDVDTVFLTGSDLRIVLWLLVIVFIYNFSKSKNIFSNEVEVKDKYMSINSVLSSYAKLKYLYFDDCNKDNKDISNILYAIMIYENHKRSKLLRSYDNLLFKLNGGKAKLGIMQVDTKKFISDSESIDIAYKKVLKIYNKRKTKDISKIINDYYGFDNLHVKYIFDIIKKF